MTRKEIIDGLEFTVGMFLFDPSTGEVFDKPRNEDDAAAVSACKGAIALLEKEPCEDVLKIPETGIGDVSDGYHTFNGLYQQRMILFAALVKAYQEKAWKSYKHEDGELCFGGGWFIVGIDTPEGSYTYHYENKYWDMFECAELPRGKHWDGHTEDDAETRLMSLSSINPVGKDTHVTTIEDAVSRKAALKINSFYHGKMPNEVNHEIWKKLKALPSVQPQRVDWDAIIKEMRNKFFYNRIGDSGTFMPIITAIDVMEIINKYRKEE